MSTGTGATNWKTRQVTKAELRSLKAKRRGAVDPIAKEFYASLLEGMKDSPWYSDDNAPSLYRDRIMRTMAAATAAILYHHGLAHDGLVLLGDFRQQLPNTFATLPAIVREWEAALSLQYATGPGDAVLRMPEGAELESLAEWMNEARKKAAGHP